MMRSERANAPSNAAQRVLIYRLGSIGDFVVALPCLHLIRTCFPAAEIGLLTNQPVESRAAPAASVLEGAVLVDRYLVYPAGDYRAATLRKVREQIRSFRPDLLVYLMERHRAWKVYRDYLFFRWCGLRRFAGLPLTSDLRNCRPVLQSGIWEPEAQRLARCISVLGKADCCKAKGWDLRLTDDETGEADEMLARASAGAPHKRRFLGLSVGTKQAINDWGDPNWAAVLTTLHPSLSEFALVLIGAAEDRERSQRLAKIWPHPVFNFCGRVPPRVSAALLRRLDALLCHDSGPMHLAAAVGTRCIAVFSNKDLPGKWFPFGNEHTILRPASPGGSIQEISPSAVVAAVHRALETNVDTRIT